MDVPTSPVAEANRQRVSWVGMMPPIAAGTPRGLEADLAMRLGGRAAPGAADNALQVHGGNGYVQEYRNSRISRDDRISHVFEGAAEIQAQVTATSPLWRNTTRINLLLRASLFVLTD
jgi:alkylation response protein AidB-like acyl-CoA dehydrogenase